MLDKLKENWCWLLVGFVGVVFFGLFVQEERYTTTLKVQIDRPAEGQIFAKGDKVEATATVFGRGLTEVTLTGPSGEVSRGEFNLPAKVKHTFCLKYFGTGSFTARAIKLKDNQVAETAVTVNVE